MKRMHSMMTLLAAGMLSCAPLAFAQSTSTTQDTGMQHPQSGAITHTPPMTSPPTSESGSMQSGSMSHSSDSSMSSSSMGSGSMMGQHDMTGTVSSVSSKDFVMVKTDDGMLKVHFPDAHTNLKKGDKITLHLGYSKDSSSM